MALFKEEFPFSNEHALNLDWILKKVKEFEDTIADYTDRLTAFSNRLDTAEGNISSLQTSVNSISASLASVSSDVADLKTTVAQHGTIIDSFQTTLTSIEDRLTIIVNDITTLYANVDRVETESISRDNALGSRVTLLESAVINPITITEAKINHIPFGDDLRIAKVNSDTGLPYGWSWVGYGTKAYTYVPNRGLEIGSSYSNDTQINIATDCYQLSRNAKYSVTIGIFSAVADITDPYGTFNPVRVLTFNNYAPEYGNPWQQLTNDTDYFGIQFKIRPNGVMELAFRDVSPGSLNGKYISYIKVIEASSAETEVHFNRKDGVYFNAVASMIASAVPSSSVTHYTDDIDSTWYPSWSGTGTEAPISANVDLYSDGKSIKGNISLFSPYDDDAIGNGSTTTDTIDVSSLEIPKVQFEGYTNQYVNMITGEMYSIYLTNGSTYLDEITIVHSFPATITPQSNGHFATIPIDTLVYMS